MSLDMDFLILICAGGIILLMVIILIVILVRRPEEPDLSEFEDEIMDAVAEKTDAAVQDMTGMINMLGTNNNQAIEQLGNYLGQNQGLAAEMQAKQLANLADGQTTFMTNMNGQLDTIRKTVSEQLESMQNRIRSLETANREAMREMRDDNSKKLDEIRGTVDEKLQSTLEKRIAESFRTVSEQLEQVYKGLGEMQAIAGDVGGLKKVLSGVKTRGILGEIQLGAILEDILTPEQYDKNVAVIPGGTQRVEFAVKLPGPDGTVYLPIDSKFPGERYQQLLDAQESGDPAVVKEAYRNLENVLKSEAKDIRMKYVVPPYTTNFGIMFLPFEGLYAEVVNHGLLESLQRDFQVSIAGPSTMAALLNSLQMGFRTLAIQKQSGEVWRVLGEVKTEFAKFEDGLKKMQSHLNQTSNDLDSLIGTRTKAINRKLRDVEELEAPETPAASVFGITE